MLNFDFYPKTTTDDDFLKIFIFRLFLKNSRSGDPTYLWNRTWKTFNSRLPGGIQILMLLALIHLTYLSELCFSNMFYGFYDDSFHKKYIYPTQIWE